MPSFDEKPFWRKSEIGTKFRAQVGPSMVVHEENSRKCNLNAVVTTT